MKTAVKVHSQIYYSTFAVSGDSMRVQWTGVAGLFIKSSDGHGDILIDPYTSGNQTSRTQECEKDAIQSRIVENSSFDKVKLIIGTHDHYDHVDDIPYIWSQWCRATDGRELSLVVPQASKERWNSQSWPSFINEWSDNRLDELLHSLTIIHPQFDRLEPTIENHSEDLIVDENRIVFGSITIQFIRQYHSNLPLGVEGKQHVHGTYALYIEDNSGIIDENMPNSISTRKLLVMSSSGLPFIHRENDEIPWRINYKRINVPTEFTELGLEPDWLFTAIKHKKALHKMFHALPTIEGVTPIHWDHGGFASPTSMVGLPSECGKRKAKRHTRDRPEHIKRVFLRNILR